MAAEDIIAVEMRSELEARLSSWKNERNLLLKAQARVVELDELIAFAEAETPTVKIAPRPRVIKDDGTNTKPSATLPGGNVSGTTVRASGTPAKP